MTCLIIDDNPLARLAVRNMLDGVEELQLIGECDSAMEAFNFLQKTACDLLLLDVEMPGMTGLELLKSLEHSPLVILITSKTEYAVAGFDLHVVDYIVKPVAFPRLLKAVQRAKELHDIQEPSTTEAFGKNHFFARVNNQLLRIDFKDILFVQALGDYVVFQTEDKKHAVHMTMKEVEKYLPADGFIRVHRSYIVSLNQILSMEQNSLQIGKHYVPVSENTKAELMKRLNVI